MTHEHPEVCVVFLARNALMHEMKMSVRCSPVFALQACASKALISFLRVSRSPVRSGEIFLSDNAFLQLSSCKQSILHDTSTRDALGQCEVISLIHLDVMFL